MSAVLRIVQGDSAPQIVKCYQDGQKLNITGYTFQFTAKQSVNDADADAAISIDWSTHTDAANGETLLDIPPSATKDLEPGTYVFDIQFKNGSAVKTLLIGKLEVIAEVTRR